MKSRNEALLSDLHRDLWVFSCGIVLSTVISIYWHDIFWFTVVALSGSVGWIGRYFIKDKSLSFPHGPANAITLLRGCLLITVTMMYQSLSLKITGLFFALICIGDILDGRLARALNMTSIIGEYMDKETDALFVLSASMILYLNYVAGVWVIGLGLLRYFYFIIMYFLIRPGQKEIKVPAARIIAGIVFTSLILSFYISASLASVLLIVSGVLLLYSFGYSARNELRPIQ